MLSKVIRRSSSTSFTVANRGLLPQCFPFCPPTVAKSTRIDGLGDKAICCPNETDMAMLHVLKGDILITIGIHGLPANAVLDPEKSMATKILANL